MYAFLFLLLMDGECSYFFPTMRTSYLAKLYRRSSTLAYHQCQIPTASTDLSQKQVAHK